jgi:hypothetical protein
MLDWSESSHGLQCSRVSSFVLGLAADHDVLMKWQFTIITQHQQRGDSQSNEGSMRYEVEPSNSPRNFCSHHSPAAGSRQPRHQRQARPSFFVPKSSLHTSFKVAKILTRQTSVAILPPVQSSEVSHVIVSTKLPPLCHFLCSPVSINTLTHPTDHYHNLQHASPIPQDATM